MSFDQIDQRQCDEYLTAVRRVEKRKAHFEKAVYCLVHNAEGRRREEAERAIAQVALEYELAPRKTAHVRMQDHRRDALSDLRKLANFLSKKDSSGDGKGARKRVIDPVARAMLRQVGIDAQKVAQAAIEAEQLLLERPGAKGGRLPDWRMQFLAPRCVRLADQFRLLGEDQSDNLDAVYNLFKELYPLATRSDLPPDVKDTQKRDGLHRGQTACRAALNRFYKKSGHKKGEAR